MKKKLEVDVGDLENSLEHANAANIESQKNIKKLQDYIRKAQVNIFLYVNFLLVCLGNTQIIYYYC